MKVSLNQWQLLAVSDAVMRATVAANNSPEVTDRAKADWRELQNLFVRADFVTLSDRA